MRHIIDANNLAGKLDLLEEDDFDKKLVEIIKKYKPNKNHEFILVFDSSDPMGDKIQEGRTTIMYTPRDNYYKSADDKILEIVKNNTELSSGYPELSSQRETIVITDDIEIKEKVKKINLDKNLNIQLEQATDFAKKLKEYFDKELIDNDNDLSEDDEKDINKELLEIWEKQT